MDVIIVYEDEGSHAVLGVAVNYTSAIDMLVNNGWFNAFLTEMSIGEEKLTLDRLGIPLENIKKWGIDKFNEKFDGLLFLDIDTIYGM